MSANVISSGFCIDTEIRVGEVDGVLITRSNHGKQRPYSIASVVDYSERPLFAPVIRRIRAEA